MKAKLLPLLQQQKTYWRQKGAIKSVKLRVATTMFFHANATIRHRGNLITHLEEREGSILTSNKDKELQL